MDSNLNRAGVNPPPHEIRDPAKLLEYKALVARDGEVCQWCGAATSLTIDHVDPNGGESLENKQLLCAPCNSSKGARTDDKTVRWQSAAWQQGFTMIPNVVMTRGLSAVAFRVYSLLLYYARQDESAWPGQEGLAEMVGCSERTVRAAVRDLEGERLVRTRRRGRGLTNVYILLAPTVSRAAGDAGLESRAAGDAALERQEMPLHRKQKQVTKTQEIIPPTPAASVIEAWQEAPGLIRHREASLRDPKLRRAVDRAVAAYGAGDVRAAILNYATVLASPEHYWTHSWTLGEFLGRGLPKFLPEARPLENFRTKDGLAGAARGVTADELLRGVGR